MNASTASDLRQWTRVTHYVSSVWFVLSALLLVPLFVRVLLVVLKYTGLRTRRDYALVVMQSAAYVAVLLLNAVNAVRRLIVLYNRQENISVPSYTCYGQPQITLMNVFVPVTGWMYVALSVDRLLLILWPLWHAKQNYTYAIRLAAPGFVYGVVMSAWHWHLSAQWSRAVEPVRAVSRLCLPSEFQAHIPRIFTVSFVTICPLISVVVFLATLYFFYTRFYRPKKEAGNDIQARRALIRQRRITKAFMTSTSLNFVFIVMPGLIALAIARPAKCLVKTPLCIVMPWAAIDVCFLNYAVDAILYNRLKEVGIGWRAWLDGKTLPKDPSAWQFGYIE